MTTFTPGQRRTPSALPMAKPWPSRKVGYCCRQSEAALTYCCNFAKASNARCACSTPPSLLASSFAAIISLKPTWPFVVARRRAGFPFLFIWNLTVETLFGVILAPSVSVSFAAASVGPTPGFSATKSRIACDLLTLRFFLAMFGILGWECETLKSIVYHPGVAIVGVPCPPLFSPLASEGQRLWATKASLQ